MNEAVKQMEMKETFKECPDCGYEDGFHSMFKKEEGVIKWFLICPNCHAIFDIGLTA
jgi:hypothetical protein